MRNLVCEKKRLFSTVGSAWFLAAISFRYDELCVPCIVHNFLVTPPTLDYNTLLLVKTSFVPLVPAANPKEKCQVFMALPLSPSQFATSTILLVDWISSLQRVSKRDKQKPRASRMLQTTPSQNVMRLSFLFSLICFVFCSHERLSPQGIIYFGKSLHYNVFRWCSS